ncbi:SRPBCC family protein [Caballeronia sp. dw_19]|uniref:CoxG family protein n=1 Tax=Caballeronia sp. dw_19 TaxID=2719791 RepID=UPI001BD68C75|nr:SRPBCC family protein [Caballeronia sp. dw_19]
MDVQLDKRYPLDVSVDQAWAILADIRSTATCMPGAAITEQVDATRYKGTVRSKIGPAVMTFGGDIEVLGIDPAAHQLRMLGKGVDKAGSSASMDLTASLEPGDGPGKCVLVGCAVVIVNGKLSQFGGRLLVPVADMMLGQFAENFKASAALVPGVAASSGGAAPASAGGAAPASAADGIASRPVKELNVMAFGWALFKGWLAGMFGKSKRARDSQ